MHTTESSSDAGDGLDKIGRSRTISSGRTRRAPNWSEQLEELHRVVLERERVDRTFDRDGRRLGDKLLAAEDRYGLLAGSLNVDENALGLGGFNRPREVVENTHEVRVRYAESRDPEMRCGYCEQAFRSTDLQKAVYWFRNHECSGEGGPCVVCVGEPDWTPEEVLDNPHLRHRKEAA